MKRVIIVHRWSGGSHDDWRPWLKVELEKKGYEVLMPDMPDTHVPVIVKWVNHLRGVVGTADKDTYFIGHSIGCQAILRYLQTIDTQVGGAVFVAPWLKLKNLEDKETEDIARPWLETPIDFEKIKSVCPNIKALLSSNEPFGCVEENKTILENQLNAKVLILENKGHFTEDDRCTELPELLTLIP